ncbi:MAG: dienelactone hydrolase family protein [Flavobacteriaceae bacterium]
MHFVSAHTVFKTVQILLFSFLLSCSMACSKSEEGEKPLSSADEMLELIARTGEHNGTMTLADGSEWKYRISVPEIPDGSKVPLLLNLHWSGGFDSYIESMRCLVEPAFKNSGYIIFSPRIGFGENWISEKNRNRVLEFLDLAKLHWPIDPNKIGVTGYSLGGTGCWNYAKDHEDYFSAAIPMAGAYFGATKINIPMTVIHGTEDELYDYDFAVEVINDNNSKGSDITLITAEGLSHQQACLYSTYLITAAEWLKNEVWK